MPKALSDAVRRGQTRHRSWRMLKNSAFGWTMAVGGIGVIVTIVMIFFYLFYVVVPMFSAAKIEQVAKYQLPLDGKELVHLSLDEYTEIGFAVTSEGYYYFFDAYTGSPIAEGYISGSEKRKLLASASGDSSEGSIFLAVDGNHWIVVRPHYALSYPNDKRHITPSLTYPLGRTPISLGFGDDESVALITGNSGVEETTIVAATSGGAMVLTHVLVEASLLGDEKTLETTHVRLPRIDYAVAFLSVDIDQRELYAVSTDGQISYFDIQDKNDPRLLDLVNATAHGGSVTSIAFLSGGISVLVGDSTGQIQQWFPVRDENNNYSLELIRGFQVFDSAIINLVPEYYRKGFLATDSNGYVGLFHTTAGRVLLLKRIGAEKLSAIAISPRADGMLSVGDGGMITMSRVQNAHPEVSWQSLWGKVWYESRSGPEYIWQSSSANSDFEPKFSLTPLTFGTVKASFYAMLFAIPLAIFGAVYTAYFMTPKMRAFVKPSVEVMAALPTVILGFLAGLWLAPLIESYLAGVFLAFILVPLSFLLVSFLLERVPQKVRGLVADGWEAAILVPVVCVAIWISLALSHTIDATFFDGNLPLWLFNQWGISYDQRNSLVVGMAIGFAVIPTIFSISEDAVFGVPRHLTFGSLALGATPWQTVIGVVILTASPGIFSAVMIGLGRAVGETMIVLMATGNTPIMDLNIFEGFRALSANIAVEMPESEVNSTHFRVLFLAALVLFLVTFAVNTVAEIVRQRLRVKYSNM